MVIRRAKGYGAARRLPKDESQGGAMLLDFSGFPAQPPRGEAVAKGENQSDLGPIRRNGRRGFSVGADKPFAYPQVRLIERNPV